MTITVSTKLVVIGAPVGLVTPLMQIVTLVMVSIQVLILLILMCITYEKINIRIWSIWTLRTCYWVNYSHSKHFLVGITGNCQYGNEQSVIIWPHTHKLL